MADLEGQFFYDHVFLLDNNIQVVKRIRYNFWKALGDIGGFYDGLRLILVFFIAPFAATLFENVLLKDRLFAQPLAENQSYNRNTLAQQI